MIKQSIKGCITESHGQGKELAHAVKNVMTTVSYIHLGTNPFMKTPLTHCLFLDMDLSKTAIHIFISGHIICQYHG